VTIRAATLAALILLPAAAPSLAKDCGAGRRGLTAAERRACADRSMRDLKPYDPRDERRTEPGFIDLGNGTTVRVRGSVGMEADVVRR
jgi:hypothetical protein